MKPRDDLRAALRLIDSLGSSGMKFGLERMRSVMKALGNPEDDYPSIHIAGTNGKGSVAAMTASILKEAGFRVGLYTSPHLETIRERFQINGKRIPARDLARLTFYLWPFTLTKGTSSPMLTQFEFLTAIAFLWFSESKIDVAVIETGLGGRLDATNVIKRKLLSVVTTIGLEHTEWLGSTIPAIAFEKAGIIKRRTPAVTGVHGTAFAVIKQVAREKQAPLDHVSPLEWRKLPLPALPLKGAHQKQNAALVVRAASVLRKSGYPIEEEHIQRGLQNVRWPGRFEVVWKRQGRRKTQIILDGAHNPPAVRVLVEAVKEEGIKKVRVLFGALRDKDAAAMAALLSPYVDKCVAVTVASDHAAPAWSLAELPAWKGRSQAAPDLRTAWEMLMSKRNTPILVTGSLYLVGATRRFLRTI